LEKVTKMSVCNSKAKGEGHYARHSTVAD
jgi:hypothetical protein